MDAEAQKLLEDTQSEDDHRSDTSPERLRHTARRHERWIIVALLVLVAASNGFWLRWQSLAHGANYTEQAYYGVPRKIHTPFDFQWYDFDEDSRVFKGDLWMKDFPDSGGMIALTAGEAAELHLEPSVEDPDDPSKQIYFMAGYHHIHCLIMMKDTLMISKTNTSYLHSIDWGHMYHCIDALRQAAWCNLDTKILRVNNLRVSPLDDKNGPVDGQKHVCTNRHAMKAWAEKYAWVDQRDGGPHRR